MANWNLTNARKVDFTIVYDLYLDGTPVLEGASYADTWEHVLANGADADTYIEDGMSKAQTVAELRQQEADQQRRFAQD